MDKIKHDGTVTNWDAPIAPITIGGGEHARFSRIEFPETSSGQAGTGYVAVKKQL